MRSSVDPRLGLLTLVLVLIVALSTPFPAVLVSLWILAIAACSLWGCRRAAAAVVGTALLVAGQVSLFRWAFAGGGPFLSGARVWAAVGSGCWVGARLGAVMLTAMLFGTLTRPADLTRALTWMKVPYRAAVLPGLALRFIPIMREEFRAVWEAQASRGLPVATARDKARALVPVGLPFIYRAIRTANELALAMELRGFGGEAVRTELRDLGFSRSEVAAMVVLIGGLGIVAGLGL